MACVMFADAAHVKNAANQSKTEFAADARKKRMSVFVKNNNKK